VKPIQPKPFPPLASTEIGYPTEKLTIDSKNELTVDKEAIGLPSDDLLQMTNLVQRESYVTQFDWSTSNGSGFLLWNGAIAPHAFVVASGDTDFVLYNTPMSWLASMFQYWRGDVILRFRFVCSQYHKGRVRISYDPDGYTGKNLATDTTTASVVMTEIIDLSKDTDVEMRIPYQQFTPWLTTRQSKDNKLSNQLFGSTATFYHTRGKTNGMITVRVSTQLSAPVASSTIKVLVFARGAENLEFAGPLLDGSDRLTPFALQADEEVIINKGNENKPEQHVIPGTLTIPADHLYLTYMGECIRSLRPVMRRKTYVMTYHPAYPAGNAGLNQYIITLNRMPPAFGYDPAGLDYAKGVVATSTQFKFNWAQATYIQYVSQAFLGYRGSINWTINVNGVKPVPHLRAFRDPSLAALRYYNTTAASNAGVYRSNVDKFWWNQRKNGAAGQALTNQVTNTGLSVQVPMYNPYKYSTTDPKIQSAAGSFFDEKASYWNTEVCVEDMIGSGAKYLDIDYYCGIGTDFDVLFFLNVPTYTYMTSNPGDATSDP